jgi:hypothetical protein
MVRGARNTVPGLAGLTAASIHLSNAARPCRALAGFASAIRLPLAQQVRPMVMRQNLDVVIGGTVRKRSRPLCHARKGAAPQEPPKIGHYLTVG